MVTTTWILEAIWKMTNYPPPREVSEAPEPTARQGKRSTTGIMLSNDSLSKLPERVTPPAYDRSKVSAGIVHIGVGNFHRAHEALYVDRCLHLDGQQEWGIIGVGLGEGIEKLAKASAVKSQNGLYTLTEFSPDGTNSIRVVGSLIDYLYAPQQTEAVLERLANPDTRIVSLTITEGGYNIDESTGEFLLTNPAIERDLAEPHHPRTVFGFIVEGLIRRRAAGLGGFTVLSCDNLRSNGAVAKKAIVTFAKARDPQLATWIESSVTFPNSMVDRIAPTVSRKEKKQVNSLAGIDDATPVIAESFIQWVLEDKFVAGRPAFERVGVELRNGVEQFEAIKGRLLNASHMMLSYPALMCGHRLVDEAVRQPVITAYLNAFMEADVMPLVEVPRGVSLQAYKRQVISRFSNPAVGDHLLRIAHNGVAKLPIFLSKTITQLLGRGGSLERIALSLACFERYLTGVDFSQRSLVVDEPHLTAADRSLLASDDPIAVLRISPFAPLGLFDSEAFREVFLATKRRLLKEGPVAALSYAADARASRR